MSEQEQGPEEAKSRKNLTVAATLPEDLKSLVVATARAYMTTSSEIVRRAVEAYFEDRPDIVAAVSGVPELPGL